MLSTKAVRRREEEEVRGKRWDDGEDQEPDDIGKASLRRRTGRIGEIQEEGQRGVRLLWRGERRLHKLKSDTQTRKNKLELRRNNSQNQPVVPSYKPFYLFTV